MKPQPDHISGMIYSRRKARVKRQEREIFWKEMITLLREESKFEAELFTDVQKHGLTFERIYNDLAGWGLLNFFYQVSTHYLFLESPIQNLLADIFASYRRDAARLSLPYTPELLEIVKQARRNKIENKTREKERERRGEILNATLKRMRKGPPAHLLAVMTPEQKEIDRIKRLPSESGYTGRIKREAGMKLKDDKTWRLEEEGDPNRQAELGMLEEEYHRLQEERAMRKPKEVDNTLS
ncbi:MAG TPA: hypothetical protein VGO47_01175 [Chlamydiales bacterium]|nr:hypothetical protein [Chlamydiales bacterium]